MATATCLSCGKIIKLGTRPKLGQYFNCDSCLSEFELVWLDPIELDWPFDDYDTDDEFEDEYDEDPAYKTYSAYEDIE